MKHERDILDHSTAPVAELIAGFATIEGDLEDAHGTLGWSISEMSIESPLELDVHVLADGSVVLGSTPPTDHVGTSFSPLLNQIKVTLAPEK